MVLETIYVIRHGYRSNWIVDADTGEYSTTIRSPTGIASDPALASYGVQQAQQLGKKLMSLEPKVDVIHSSPFYRCLQTLAPFTEALAEKGEVTVNVEPGVGEFYGLARFDHPSPAKIEVLNEHFPNLKTEKNASIIPSTKGESITQLHNRIAYCLRHIIRRADADPAGPKTLLICTHAASMICIGRALTGVMPEDYAKDEFNCFTCSLSKFDRRGAPDKNAANDGPFWSPEDPDTVPDIQWRGGKGVEGGWDCIINGDCSFLAGGEERGWQFGIEKQQLAEHQERLEAAKLKAPDALLKVLPDAALPEAMPDAMSETLPNASPNALPDGVLDTLPTALLDALPDALLNASPKD